MQKINKYGRIVSTYTWALTTTATARTFSGSNNYRVVSEVTVDDDVNTTIQLRDFGTGCFVYFDTYAILLLPLQYSRCCCSFVATVDGTEDGTVMPFRQSIDIVSVVLFVDTVL